MYKDKDKQREAGKERARRYRESHPISGKRRDEGVTSEGVTDKALPNEVIPCDNLLKEYEDMHPGLPTCVPSLKRGKDIKCFADLPSDVQQAIDEVSESNEEKARRTQAAIRYQHLFPASYDNQSFILPLNVVTGKPGDADYDGICTPEWRAARGR